MEREDAKKILVFSRDIDGEISLNNRVIRDYEDRYYTLGGGGTLDAMPKGKGKTSTPTETIALNIPESASAAMRELQKHNERLEKLKSEILLELNRLPYTQKSILYDFYIRRLQWVQITARIHYSGTRCKQIRNRGLDNLATHFSKNGLIKNFNYPN